MDATDQALIDELTNEITAEVNERTAHSLNRAQRRKLMKHTSKKNRQSAGLINETTKKLSYINLIQKLRELNEKKENEQYEDSIEDN